MKQPVIIDTDPAIGFLGKDVDDGLAILALLADPSLDVLGLSITFGNVSQEKAFAAAKEILTQANRSDIPVFSGARGAFDFGRKTKASAFLIESANTYQNDLAIVALGPLTNLATAASKNTEFLQNLKQLLVLGGSKYYPSLATWKPGFEFNFRQDVLAAKFVLSQSKNLTLFPMEPCRYLTLGALKLWKLSRIGGAASWAAQKSLCWTLLSPFVWNAWGFHPWDVLPALALSQPDIFCYEENAYEVGDLGKLLINEASSKIRVVSDVDTEKFWITFWERFSHYRES